MDLISILVSLRYFFPHQVSISAKKSFASRYSIPAVNSVAVTNISYNLEHRPTFHRQSYGRGFQLPTSVKLRFLQETELRADWQAGKWWEGRCTIPGNASPNPGHPTTSAVPPKSCQSHPKVASFTQKLPVSPKSRRLQPKLAMFIQMLLMSTGKCRFHKKLPVSHKSFCLPSEKVFGFTHKLQVSTKN